MHRIPYYPSYASFLAKICLLDNSSKKIKRLSKFLLSYLLIVFVSTIILRFFDIHYEIRFVLDFLISVSATTLNISAIVLINFRKAKHLTRIVLLFYLIDNDLSVKKSISNVFLLRNRHILLLNSIVSLFIFTELYVCLTDTYVFFRFYHLPIYTNLFLASVVILQYISTVSAVSTRCEILRREKHLKLLLKNYFRIYKIIELINSVYGVQLLIMFTLVLLFLIKTIVLSLYHTSPIRLFAISNCLGTVAFFVLGITTVYCCNKTCNTLNDDSVLTLFQTILKTTNREKRQKIGLLTRFLIGKQWKFSAANVFTINFGLVFAMLGSVSSFVILSSSFYKITHL